jgi:hypothetical protein
VVDRLGREASARAQAHVWLAHGGSKLPRLRAVGARAWNVCAGAASAAGQRQSAHGLPGTAGACKGPNGCLHARYQRRARLGGPAGAHRHCGVPTSYGISVS